MFGSWVALPESRCDRVEGCIMQASIHTIITIVCITILLLLLLLLLLIIIIITTTIITIIMILVGTNLWEDR